jgi:hypothetical protein
MTDVLSSQSAKLDATPRQYIKANESGGRMRRTYFDYTVKAGNLAINDRIKAGDAIPKGARIFGGQIAFEAMSTAGGAASAQIGDGTTATKYLGTTSVDAAGTAAFGNTVALFYGEELAADLQLWVTAVTEAWLAGQKIAGHIDWMLD